MTVADPCRRCADSRTKPLDLVTLPSEVTAEEFRRPELAIVLCAACDGDAVERAIELHRQREADAEK